MPPRTKPARTAPQIYLRLKAAHPDACCELAPRNPFRLLVAVILSAQTTDVGVNKLLPSLFESYPDASSLACAKVSDVEEKLKTIGMFRQKARNIVGMAKLLVSEFGSSVPANLDALMSLPGVGRKTANVVLGVAFGIPSGVVVDTHVQRLSQRLGWTRHKVPEKIEKALERIFPEKDWIALSHVLIFHGRRVCTARAPNCAGCPVADACPSAFAAAKVGRKKVQAASRSAHQKV